MFAAQLIKTMLNKDAFDKFHPYLTKEHFNDTKGYYWGIYKALESYFHSSDDSIQLEDLKHIHLSSCDGMAEEKVEAYKEIYNIIDECEVTDAATYLLNKVRRTCVLLKSMENIEKNIDNPDDDALLAIVGDLSDVSQGEDDEEESKIYTNSLMVADEDYKASQQWVWPFPELNKAVKGAGAGRNCLIVALTNVGKTSFTVFSCVEFMKQGARVLHFSIAEDSKVGLQRRYYQAAFNASDDELDANKQFYNDKFTAQFNDRLFLAPVDSLNIVEAEHIIKQVKPDVVVFDDFKDVDLGKKQDMRMDKMFGQIAVRLRALGIKHNFFTLCAAQASDSATGKKKLDRQDIADSKVDIPGKFHYAIGISAAGHDPNKRYISFIKNKMGAEDLLLSATIDKDRCQWYSV